MKFAINTEDRIALVISLVHNPNERIAGVEAQDARISAWEDLGVRKLARTFALRLAAGQGQLTGAEIIEACGKQPAAKKVLVDLQASSVASLIGGIAAGVPGVYLDQLTDVRRDLQRLQSKTYELPKELRGKEPRAKATTAP